MKQLGYIVLLLLLAGCENINYRSSVPYAPVDYTLHITREYPNFVTDNGFQTITITQGRFEKEYIGYSGLLVWVGMDNNYHAADLCCPHCVKRNKPIVVDGIFAVCKECGEYFDISYGYGIPTKGITREPLKLYITRYSNFATGGQLHIQN